MGSHYLVLVLRRVGRYRTALSLHESDVGGVGAWPLDLGALARIDNDRARAHARQRDHLIRRGKVAITQLARSSGQRGVFTAAQRCDLRACGEP